MIAAALYDIHGNLPALEAVVCEARRAGVDRILVGGDVFPGPMASESLDYLLGLDVPVEFIVGNGDREVLAVARGAEPANVAEQYHGMMRWMARQLRPDQQALVATWPLTVRVAIPGLGEVAFCHATPRNDNDIFTRLTSEDRLLPVFEGLGVPLVVCGHTHMQFDRAIGRTRVVNAGSVGMPFGAPGADWLLLGPDVQLRRTSYDLEKAAERIRATEYPDAAQFAAKFVLDPPSEQTMLEAFKGAEPEAY